MIQQSQTATYTGKESQMSLFFFPTSHCVQHSTQPKDTQRESYTILQNSLYKAQSEPHTRASSVHLLWQIMDFTECKETWEFDLHTGDKHFQIMTTSPKADIHFGPHYFFSFPPSSLFSSFWRCFIVGAEVRLAALICVKRSRKKGQLWGWFTRLWKLHGLSQLRKKWRSSTWQKLSVSIRPIWPGAAPTW